MSRGEELRAMNAAGTTWAHIEAYQADDNAWWFFDCGHHQNMLDLMLERVRELELGREADRRRITELETAAHAVVKAEQQKREGVGPVLGVYDAVAALRSVLAAEHTQPEAP